MCKPTWVLLFPVHAPSLRFLGMSQEPVPKAYCTGNRSRHPTVSTMDNAELAPMSVSAQPSREIQDCCTALLSVHSWNVNSYYPPLST